MQGIGIVIIGFVAILFLSLQADEGGLFRAATSTSTGQDMAEQQVGNGDTFISAPRNEARSEQEIEREVSRLYDELDRLSEEVRAFRLREPASPHRGTVSLRAGTARDDDPEREYLVLSAARTNTEPVHISDWYLESYVSKNRAAIPQGTRVLESFRSRTDTDILLEPGEQAYLLTSETPLNVSFKENACSGYLTHEADFYPSLRWSCPRPMGEIRDSSIPLDDDVCYEFVESLSTCEYVGENDIEELANEEDLSRQCERFLEETFNYNSCVEKHKSEPLFDDVGSWRIYLDRRDELWRSEREIIRLMDENDRVITVIEY